MSGDYKWENPNSKIVEYGGPALAGVIIWLMLLFYPAVVIGIQAHQWGADETGAIIAGVITLSAITVLWAGAKSGSSICLILVVGIYVVCLVPFCQWMHHVYTAEYVSSAPNNFDKEPFPGFDWFWFIPSSNNQVWNWDIFVSWIKNI